MGKTDIEVLNKINEGICKWCNKNFILRKQDLKKGYSLFCGKECYDNYQRRNHKIHKCKVCSTLFLFRKGQKRYFSNISTCSKECENEYRSINKKNNLNPNWKGDNVGSGSLHEWVHKHKIRPLLCEKCHTNKVRDLHNIDGKYTRNLSSWIWLCRKCHMITDNRINMRDKYGRMSGMSPKNTCA